MHLKKSTGVIASTLAALSATAAFAATTPYDLIRPTWPLSWDSTAIGKFDTTVTKKIGVLDIDKTPASFKAGALMPDTLDQAYFDAINTKISPIRVNQAGYLKSDTERQFYFVGSKATEFEVVDADGKSLSTKITGTFTATETATKSDWTIIAGTNAATNDQKRYKVEITGPEGNIFVGKIPQNVPTEKRLRIKVGDEVSSTFIVSDDVYTMAKDATLKFFGIQRSGNSESWFHGPSHTKDGGGAITTAGDTTSSFDASRAGTLAGGWYDCGDHLKESQTMAYAFMTLAVMHATNPVKDVDHYDYNQGEFVKTDGVPDVLREAKHGADFFLRAYEFAKGVVDDMPVSVGSFGSDHGWWGRPEAQDYLPTDNSSAATDRGGPAARIVRLGELGSNISSEIAAGLAILSKDYAKYDKKFADSCLVVAEKMYAFAKDLAQGKTFKNNKAAIFATPARNGNNEFTDDLALASVALLYATGKKVYADDMIRTTELFASQKIRDGAGFFAGGWFATENSGMLKNVKNTSWANAHSFALYALYKLILADKTKATSEYGLTEDERLAAIEDCLADMIANLGDMSYGYGTTSIELPADGISWMYHTVKYDPTWYTMFADSRWVYNSFQAADIFEVLAYADVAADIEKQGIKLPTMASTGLKASEMRQLGINQLNYLLGVNPWDISFVYGIGDKNDAHPYHRAANPEGKNTPGLNYKYNCPVGALFGGTVPGDSSSLVPESETSWKDYRLSETCLDVSATLLSALTFVSNGGSDYYEKKCDNCKTGEINPFSGEVYATAYHYFWIDSTDFFSINFYNETLEDADSVVAYIYFDATEEDVDACGATFLVDICRAYDMDMGGFDKPCSDAATTMAKNMSTPKKVDDTYNKDKKTYIWEQAISIGTISLGGRLRLDIGISSGTKVDGKCEVLLTPSKVKVTDGWSFTAHTATKDAPAYAGAPDWDKDQGDIQEPPQDPYIVLRSKGKLLWGYGPGKTTSDRVGFVAPKTTIAKARMQVAKNKLYVLATAQGTKTVKIFDMLGNQLMAKDFYGTRAEVNLAKLPHRGALIARVMAGSKLLASKVIKIR